MFRNCKAKLPLMAAIVASAAGTAAFADISNEVFTIVAEATNAQGQLLRAEWTALFDDGYWNPDTLEYDWALPAGQMPMLIASDGTVLGGLANAGVYCREDPQVDLNFSVFAGALNTTFTITSPHLSFASMSNTQGRTSAGFSLTDLDGDGVSLQAWNGGNVYTSRYNGYVPGGTTFHDHFAGTYGTVDPFGSFSISEDFPGGGLFDPIGPAVTDMSSRFRFTLSANDIASGTSVYEIIPIPAPGTVALLGLGGLLAGRRRR